MMHFTDYCDVSTYPILELKIKFKFDFASQENVNVFKKT
jgi:hypothetical protein